MKKTEIVSVYDRLTGEYYKVKLTLEPALDISSSVLDRIAELGNDIYSIAGGIGLGFDVGDDTITRSGYVDDLQALASWGYYPYFLAYKDMKIYKVEKKIA